MPETNEKTQISYCECCQCKKIFMIVVLLLLSFMAGIMVGCCASSNNKMMSYYSQPPIHYNIPKGKIKHITPQKINKTQPQIEPMPEPFPNAQSGSFVIEVDSIN